MGTLDRKRLVEGYYSSRAKDYDRQKARTWNTAQGFGTDVVNEILEALRNFRSGTLLEVGVGSGRTALILLGTIEPWFIGLDLSKEMLTASRSKLSLFKKRLDLVLGDADRLFFKEESFDAIVCMSAMHYFESQAENLKAFCRVLKENGIFVCGDLTLHEKDDNRFFDKLEKRLSKVHVKYYRPSEMKILIEVSGFDVFKMKTITYRKSYQALIEDKGEYFGVDLNALLEQIEKATPEAQAQYELTETQLTQFYTVITAVKPCPRR